jgi:hypothetical protein
MLPPKKLPIDMMTVDTAKGAWGIFVEHLAETQGQHNLFVRIILEQTIDDEHFRMRNLEMLVNAEEARDPDFASDIAKRIGQWIETIDGDGFIDLTAP